MAQLTYNIVQSHLQTNRLSKTKAERPSFSFIAHTGSAFSLYCVF